jgi:hypothetical protein
MKSYFDLIVVIPVGPGTPIHYITDTIDSFISYTLSTFKIILIDDSHQGICKKVQHQYTHVEIVYTEKNSGSMAGLYLTLSTGYAHALKTYRFTALLKLDTDALVIGAAPEAEILEQLQRDTTIGMAGQYPVEYSGRPWDIAWPKARIVNATSSWKMIRRPMANLLLRKYFLLALKNGYNTGESVFGGAYFLSAAFLKSLEHHQLLPHPLLGKLNLGEDHLFSLLAKALGFQLVDLCTNDAPFACAWKGLPADPKELIHKGKKIIHSTRCYNDMNEDDIRRYFRDKRKPAETITLKEVPAVEQ